ncbi:MAG: GH116 family glycosyl-hydrolase, partial [Bacteroidota bacterium]
MPRSGSLKISDIFTISGSQISEIYVDNQMLVHFQGMSKTLQFPHTIALQGAPTCSIGISPDGLYNRLNDAGRLILLNQNAIQLGSAPFIRIGDKYAMLTTKDPKAAEGPDDVPALKNYYHPALSEKQISISLATPLVEMAYNLGKVKVIRRMISPLLSGNAQALMPIGVEEYEVKNTSNKEQQITLVIPRPSLVNLQEKELKPTDQDTVYVCSAPVKGHVHEGFCLSAAKGVVMGSKECADRMVVAVPGMEGMTIDTQPYFCLNRLKQDLLLNGDGSFYEKREPIPNQDYGAAVSLTFTLKPSATVKIPVAIVLDFPQQRYIDGRTFERKYVKSFEDEETRAMGMARIALENHSEWLNRT